MKAFSVKGPSVKGFFGPNALTIGNPFPPPPASGGKTWTPIVTGFENNIEFWTSVQFVNGNWVIVAHSGAHIAIYTSTNTVTWTKTIVSLLNRTTRGIAFGAATYVIAAFVSGSNHNAFTSPDLVTWTGHTVAGWIGADSPNNIAFGNGIFVWTNQNGQYATSPDGATWTQRNAYTPNIWGATVFDGTNFQAVVTNGANVPKLVTSADGINWTEVATLTLTHPLSLGVNASTQAVCGDQTDDTGNSVATLTTVSSFNFGDGLPTETIAYGGGSWARSNENNQHLRSSSNGTVWNTDTVPANATFLGACSFGNGIFMSIGQVTGGNHILVTRGP